MAEHDQDNDNDEYKFPELDTLDNESLDDETETHESLTSAESRPAARGTDVKRNALIALAVIFCAIGAYKIFSWMYSGKPNNSAQVTTPPAIKVIPQTTQTQTTTTTPPPTTTVVQPTQPVVTPVVDEGLKEKVLSIEQSQLMVKAEVTTVGEQIVTVNNNINNLNTQIANLNQVITNLTDQVAKQSEEINVLMARSRPKVMHKMRRVFIVPRTIYHIQAVIPGRAWLIGSNGSTLTVREGTRIAGYGIVRLIDSLQGRVLTSSGQVIKFSQEDS